MDINLLLDKGPIVLAHVLAALAAFGLGLFVLFRRKGGWVHKLSGRIWVALMAIVTISSMFINEIRMFGPFSPIHFLSVYTFVALVLAIVAIRSKDVDRHRSHMQYSYFFGIVVAGAFTFLPQRLLAKVLGGEFLANVAPFIWIAVPVLVFAIYKTQRKRRPIARIVDEEIKS